MTWFKVDDSFYDHPKVYDAPDASLALWLRAGTWSARNLTNGFVPSGMLARFCGDPAAAARDLVARGLWQRASGGYQFHDWADYQPTKEKVEDDRRRHAEAQARYRQKQRPRDGPDDRRVIDHQSVSDSAPTRPDHTPLRGVSGRRRATPAARADPQPPPPRCPRHEHQTMPCATCRSEQIGAT